jgi:hypothetical protein
MGKASADEPIDFQSEKVAPVTDLASNGTCNDNTPIMVVLCIISVSLLVPIGVLVSKIKSINNDGAHTEMT